MKYVDEFRRKEPAGAIAAMIRRAGGILRDAGRRVRIMEVCGSHTMAIARFGLRQFLPENVLLISGPGCPVCVTDPGYIDAAIALAARGAVISTFGDMLRVPGSTASLSDARAEGADVRVCYTPAHAIDLARDLPDRDVVFLAVGFETTAAPIVAMLDRAYRSGLGNLTLLVALKRIPPILDALAAADDIAVDAFLCPAHVSAIIGARVYEAFAERHTKPCVVAGFEPLDILYGVAGLLEQLARREASVVNQYGRVVRSEGNPRALSLMNGCLETAPAVWRGLGEIPDSGYRLRPAFAAFDAESRFGVSVTPGRVHPGCRCGDVLKGMIEPPQCRLFGRACTPEHPYGPCMVSSEGSCAARYKYARCA